MAEWHEIKNMYFKKYNKSNYKEVEIEKKQHIKTNTTPIRTRTLDAVKKVQTRSPGYQLFTNDYEDCAVWTCSYTQKRIINVNKI